MKVHWTDLAITTLLVGAGCAGIYAGLARVLRRAVAGRQHETEQQLRALATTVKELQARVAELGESQAARAEVGDIAAITGAPENMARAESTQIKPQTLAAITAAAATLLGRMRAGLVRQNRCRPPRIARAHGLSRGA